MARFTIPVGVVLALPLFSGWAIGQETRKIVPIPAFKVLAPAASDDELRKLLKQRYTAVATETTMAAQRFRGFDGINSNDLVEVATRALKAIADVADTLEEKQALLAPLLDFAKGIEKYTVAELGVPATLAQRSALSRAVAFRLEVEIEVLRAKKKGGKE